MSMCGFSIYWNQNPSDPLKGFSQVWTELLISFDTTCACKPLLQYVSMIWNLLFFISIQSLYSSVRHTAAGGLLGCHSHSFAHLDSSSGSSLQLCQHDCERLVHSISMRSFKLESSRTFIVPKLFQHHLGFVLQVILTLKNLFFFPTEVVCRFSSRIRLCLALFKLCCVACQS